VRLEEPLHITMRSQLSVRNGPDIFFLDLGTQQGHGSQTFSVYANDLEAPDMRPTRCNLFLTILNFLRPNPRKSQLIRSYKDANEDVGVLLHVPCSVR
jgi:hypothetical protein